jgi:membrane-associated phospholipid phosphatase
MALITIKPTDADIRIANAIASRTTPFVEQTAEVATWGADENILLALAVCGWVYVSARRPALRPVANHFLITSLVATVLPHLMKRAVDQTRPDRLTVRGHWRGIPFSGRSRDAFPSGHALHMGALASAAGLLDRRPRQTLQAIACGLSLTRILLLAHWTSDVVAGFLIGGAVERVLRRLTLRKSLHLIPMAGSHE